MKIEKREGKNLKKMPRKRKSQCRKNGTVTGVEK